MCCNYNQQGRLAFAFGLGLTISCFFPDRFVLMVIAIILIILSIALIKC